MKAEYDSVADALSIDLEEVDRSNVPVSVDDTSCQVSYSDGRPVNVELLSPARSLDLLAAAARETGSDLDTLEAAAQAALAAPDRVITLDFSAAPLS